MNCAVKFFPEEIEVEVQQGTDLFKAAILAGIELKGNCGQKGTCGRCKVKILDGPVTAAAYGSLSNTDRENGYCLACRTLVQGNVKVFVPADSRLEEHKVLHDNRQGLTSQGQLLDGYKKAPLCRRLQVAMEPPDLTDNASDLTRLTMAIRQQTGEELKNKQLSITWDVLKNLAGILRQGNWEVTVTLVLVNNQWEIISASPGYTCGPVYGLAVDIGTTTVVVYLVNIDSGEIVSHHGSYNRQAVYGDDVISRIIYADEQKDGLQDLQKAVVNTVNDLIEKCLRETSVAPEDVCSVVAAGNTTMTQFLTGVTPKYVRLEPYIPTMNHVPAVRAKELGIKVHPEALINLFPSVASYVGGDIVSGALFTRLTHRDEVTLFVDIGTNGEIILGNKEWLVSCACSAGPAFEGGGITFGTRATNGAIERIIIDETLNCQVKTISNYPAVGICGSGLIDTLAKLREVGVIDRTGKFQKDIDSPRIRENNEGLEYVLVWAADSGNNQDIVFTEADARNLVRAKGAVFAGIRSLLSVMELDESIISQIIIAGGFGNFLNVKDAVRIGLLPDTEFNKYKFIGNSSVKGSYLALLSEDAWEEALHLGSKITYMELSIGNTFMDEYVSALFLPHTDLSLFPSVEAENKGQS